MRTVERLKASVVAAVSAVVVEIVVAVAAAAAEFDVGSAAAAADHEAAMRLSRWWETWAVVNL
jgi:hypothetical protein